MCMFIKNLFGKKERSAEEAKNRINVLIRYDRAGVNPELLENIKRDIIKAVSAHIEYDPSKVEAKFIQERNNESVLVASIPITRIKRPEEKKRNSGGRR